MRLAYRADRQPQGAVGETGTCGASCRHACTLFGEFWSSLLDNATEPRLLRRNSQTPVFNASWRVRIRILSQDAGGALSTVISGCEPPGTNRRSAQMVRLHRERR